MSDVVAFSPSWTPNTTRSNFESASISNEILRDNQRLLEGSVDDKDREISQVLLMSYLLLLLLLSLNCLFFLSFLSLQLKSNLLVVTKELEAAQQTLKLTRQEATQVIDSKIREIESLKGKVHEDQDKDAQLHYLQGKLEVRWHFFFLLSSFFFLLSSFLFFLLTLFYFFNANLSIPKNKK